jgi:hypothetical protein
MELNTTIFDENVHKENEISEVKEFVQKKNYDHNKKMELVKRINKIKKKEYLLNIFKIILLHSKDYTENNNGVFVFFHNLEDEVYEQIENYVNKIYKMHKKSTSSNILNIYNSELSDSQNFFSDTIEIDNDKNLSNKEKLIMRRKKYEKYLDQNQEK